MTDRAPRRTRSAATSGSTAAPGGGVDRPPPRTDRLDDRLTGWLVTLAITAIAGFLRFWHLGRPREFLFDETYYAKDGWSLWRYGYARNWVEDADEKLLSGGYRPRLQNEDPTMVVHPDVGKWLIGAGEQLFGLDAFGWRFASAVVGTLMVAVLIRLVRRLTGSTLLGGVAGVLLCFDGLHFVLSRLALLDIFVAFFMLCGVSCLVADRDHGRARLAALAARDPGGRPDPSAWGPVRGLRWRPWRLAAGVFFGLAIGSKWSALVPLAGFGLLVLAWDAGARRALGVRHPLAKAAVVDGVLAFGYLVGVAFLVYVATWAGWLAHAHAYEVGLAENAYGPFWGSYTRTEARGFFPATLQGLRSLWHYHHDVWAFHSTGLLDATHVYQSDPRGWLLLNRPVGVAANLDIRPGTQGCTAPADSSCLRQVLLLGTPALWWAGVAALLYAGYAWLARRDWRFGLVVVGVVTTLVPFFRYAGRPIFSFYSVTTLPFTVIAVVMVIGLVMGPATAPSGRRVLGTAAAGAYVLLVVLNFAWFWPIYTHELLTTPEWLERVWLKSWI